MGLDLTIGSKKLITMKRSDVNLNFDINCMPNLTSGVHTVEMDQFC